VTLAALAALTAPVAALAAAVVADAVIAALVLGILLYLLRQALQLERRRAEVSRQLSESMERHRTLVLLLGWIGWLCFWPAKKIFAR